MPVRVGFLGAGLVARIHRRSLSAVADRIVWAGVHDTDGTRARRFAEETGARHCGSAAELLSRADAVYVCTWTSEHPDLVRDAVDRGLAVYCEKPLAVSLSSARAMTDHVVQAGSINQTGLVLRHSPAFRWLRRLITDPKSGSLMSISFRDDQYLPVAGYYGSTWRSDPSLAGSGVLLEHSIHDIDILEYLAGPIRQMSCVTRSVHGIPGIEDVAVASFTFASGVPGTLTTVWHDMLERPNERRVEVLCGNLWCVLDGNHHSGPVSWQWKGEPSQTAEGEDLLALLAPSSPEDFNPDAAFIHAVERSEDA
jgi:UDP-N-acetyl-2-amino-2-deoxyglucuronate dehydrogenase